LFEFEHDGDSGSLQPIGHVIVPFLPIDFLLNATWKYHALRDNYLCHWLPLYSSMTFTNKFDLHKSESSKHSRPQISFSFPLTKLSLCKFCLVSVAVFSSCLRSQSVVCNCHNPSLCLLALSTWLLLLSIFSLVDCKPTSKVSVQLG
jgi:hypothetical protein